MSDTLVDSRVAKVAGEITRYLAAHPKACDTVAGIRQWWIAGTGATVEEISAALDRLVRLGQVQRVSLQSGEAFRARR
jgi:hypothetical protein